MCVSVYLSAKTVPCTLNLFLSSYFNVFRRIHRYANIRQELYAYKPVFPVIYLPVLLPM